MTPAEQKQAEANGTGLKEIKSEVASNSSSEELPPFQKRSRRKECIYITIAVVLGAGLIAVLVYFSVTNALKESEPEERKNTGAEHIRESLISFAKYSTTESTTPLDYNFDYQSNNDYLYEGGNGQSGNSLTRDASVPSKMTRNMGGDQNMGPQARGLPGGDQDMGPQTRGLPGGDQDMGPQTRGLPGGDQDMGPQTRGLPGGDQDMGPQTRGLPGGDQVMGPQTRGLPVTEDDEQADTQNTEGTGQHMLTRTNRLLEDQTDGGESGTDAGMESVQTISGNTDQEEQVEDTVQESSEQSNPVDNSIGEVPQKMARGRDLPDRMPVE